LGERETHKVSKRSVKSDIQMSNWDDIGLEVTGYMYVYDTWLHDNSGRNYLK